MTSTKNKFRRLISQRPGGAVFFGDWHADMSFAVSALERAIEKYPQVEVYYHVGDFGLGFSRQEAFAHTVADILESSNKILVVTGGNHEDWDAWDELTNNQTQPFIYPGDSLTLLPKVWYWEHAGARFASVGGASSIDRQWRVEGRSWWPQEIIAEDAVVTVENSKHGPVDYLITHEASDDPVLPVRQILQNPFLQMKWPYDDVVESEVQRRRVSRVIDALQPRTHIHGHWHLPYKRTTDALDTVSLGANFASYEENSYVVKSFDA